MAFFRNGGHFRKCAGVATLDWGQKGGRSFRPNVIYGLQGFSDPIKNKFVEIQVSFCFDGKPIFEILEQKRLPVVSIMARSRGRYYKNCDLGTHQHIPPQSAAAPFSGVIGRDTEPTFYTRRGWAPNWSLGSKAAPKWGQRSKSWLKKNRKG